MARCEYSKIKYNNPFGARVNALSTTESGYKNSQHKWYTLAGHNAHVSLLTPLYGAPSSEDTSNSFLGSSEPYNSSISNIHASVSSLSTNTRMNKRTNIIQPMPSVDQIRSSCKSSFVSHCKEAPDAESWQSSEPLPRCHICNFVFKTKAILVQHQKFHNATDEESFKCLAPKCDIIFPTESGLKNHADSHSNRITSWVNTEERNLFFTSPLWDEQEENRDDVLPKSVMLVQDVNSKPFGVKKRGRPKKETKEQLLMLQTLTKDNIALEAWKKELKATLRKSPKEERSKPNKILHSNVQKAEKNSGAFKKRLSSNTTKKSTDQDTSGLQILHDTDVDHVEDVQPNLFPSLIKNHENLSTRRNDFDSSQIDLGFQILDDTDVDHVQSKLTLPPTMEQSQINEQATKTSIVTLTPNNFRLQVTPWYNASLQNKTQNSNIKSEVKVNKSLSSPAESEANLPANNVNDIYISNLLLQCDKCNQKFLPDGLQAHILSHAAEEQVKYVCCQCNIYFATWRELSIHSSFHLMQYCNALQINSKADDPKRKLQFRPKKIKTHHKLKRHDQSKSSKIVLNSDTSTKKSCTQSVQDYDNKSVVKPDLVITSTEVCKIDQDERQRSQTSAPCLNKSTNKTSKDKEIFVVVIDATQRKLQQTQEKQTGLLSCIEPAVVNDKEIRDSQILSSTAKQTSDKSVSIIKDSCGKAPLWNSNASEGQKETLKCSSVLKLAAAPLPSFERTSQNPESEELPSVADAHLRSLKSANRDALCEEHVDDSVVKQNTQNSVACQVDKAKNVSNLDIIWERSVANVSSVAVQNFKCDCDKVILDSKDGIIKFYCAKCKVFYITDKDIQEHKNIHSREDQTITDGDSDIAIVWEKPNAKPNSMPTSEGGPIKFFCMHCEEFFKTSAELQSHENCNKSEK